MKEYRNPVRRPLRWKNSWNISWKILILGILSSLVGMVSSSFIFVDRSIQAKSPQPKASQSATRIFQLSANDRQKLITLQTQFQKQQWQNLEFGDRIQQVAQQFIGDPYRAYLLDQSPTEQPFISLSEFDCVLFLETVLALTSVLSSAQPVDMSPTAYPSTAVRPLDHGQDHAQVESIENNLFQEIQRYRYHDGKLESYCNRLHYFSDWVLDNQRRGLVKDVGIIPLKRSLNFMTEHWQKYPKIVNNQSLKNCIQTAESTISQKLQDGQLNYIPIDRLRQQEPNLRSGDLIGLVTDIKGLDVTHSGFLYRQGLPGSKSPVGLLHASVRSGIKISPNLERYVRGVEGAIGIIVARPQARPQPNLPLNSPSQPQSQSQSQSQQPLPLPVQSPVQSPI